MANKLSRLFMSAVLLISGMSFAAIDVSANDSVNNNRTISNVESNKNIVTITYSDGLVGKLTLLEDDIFRWHLDPKGEFAEYAKPNAESHKGTIQVRDDSSNDYQKPKANVNETQEEVVIKSGETTIKFNKDTTLMSVYKKDKEVLKETKPLVIEDKKAVQTLGEEKQEYFFGGGTQNGRFTHKGQSINIVNESNWVDGGVASPNPFYWSTSGYGVLRNTFKPGKYDFGKSEQGTVSTQHNDGKFDAYYFVGETPKELLQGYFKVTGNPVLLPEYAYYLGHLNAYNRDGWSETNLGNGKAWKLEDGKTYYEHGRVNSYKLPIDANTGKIPSDSKVYPETLNGTSPLSDAPKDMLYKFSARAVIDGHEKYDMPLGYFLPNDGYGAGYGQNGYYKNYPLGSDPTKKGRIEAVDANIQNLKDFSDYAKKKGIMTGLWTQSALTPDTSEKDSYGYFGYQTLRDFEKEVNTAGVRTLKTDVAWVGHGYSMALDSTKTGFEGIGATNSRPNIITLDGWAGTQRHGAIWTGDQTGGNWEYIRFHIPTYIGQGLAGNPNVGSDIDGIFGGSALITTRDLQWKTFTPLMLDMDGWGDIPKKPYNHSEDNDNINRMYLKLKSELMPYLYTTAHEAVEGLPMIRAMFLEYPNDPKGYTKDVQYQFMYGSQFLVAPVYQNTQADKDGNDIRNGIYLPDANETWIDYFTGEAYRGGQTLNGFDAPLWKLPLFVKKGSIVPMYEENNNPQPLSADNPKGIDKSKRVVEFYPAEKETKYTAIEDDGITMDGVDSKGNEKSTVTYGGKVETTYTSNVKDGKATLTIEPSKGSYTGYNAQKITTAIVNATKKPDSIEVKAGSKVLDVIEASSYEEFESLKEESKSVFFYDETPNLNKYSQGEGAFASTEITTTPKIHIAIPTVNAQTEEIVITIDAFEFAHDLGKDELNPNLIAPTFGESETTPTSILINWSEVSEATGYDLMVDGEIQSGFKQGQFKYLHNELAYGSEHTYRVRSRNAEGYSNWSDEVTINTDLDPWRNVPIGKPSTTIEPFHPAYGLEQAFDQKFDGTFFTNQGGNDKILGQDIIIEYDDVYTFDTFTYHNNMPNHGRLGEADISVSYDGIHWTKVFEGSSDPFDPAKFTEVVEGHPQYTVKLDENARGKYIKLTPTKIINGGATSGFSASEFIFTIVDKSPKYPLGDITLDGVVNDNDFTHLDNYKGTVRGDGKFENQVEANNADINRNGVFDVYDYSFVLTQLDGGTKKIGKPEGSIMIDTNKVTELKAGETASFKIIGKNLKNVNALGAILSYDVDTYEVLNIKGSDAVKDMIDLSTKAAGEGDKRVATLSFNNKGEQALIEGADVELIEVTIKARKDAPMLVPEDFMLIGTKNELLEVETNIQGSAVDKSALKASIDAIETKISKEDMNLYTEESIKALNTLLASAKAVYEDEEATHADVEHAEQSLKDAAKLLKKIVYNPESGISSILFMNDALEQPVDGKEMFQQDNWEEMLFDGNLNDLVEFKYFYGMPDDLPAHVKVPTDFIFKLDGAKYMDRVRVYNRVTGSNGVITAIEASAVLESGETILLGSYDTQKEVYEFEFKTDKKVREIIITPKETKGLAPGTETGTEENRMLSIREIEFFGRRVETVIDTSELEALVIKAKKIDKELYTPKSVEVLEAAIQNAESILNKRSISQESVNAAIKQLNDAITNLVERADFEELNALLDSMKVLKEKDYTEETWNNLVEAINHAEKVTKNLNATQTEVDEEVQVLTAVFDELVEIINPGKVVNKNKLLSLIKNAEKLNKADYTETSWSAFEKALNEAKLVLENENATQEEVNTVLGNLAASQNQLEKVSDQGGTTDPTLPGTGISSMPMFIAVGMSLLGAFILLLNKKKQRH